LNLTCKCQNPFWDGLSLIADTVAQW
jgi:hypothetical protein